MTREEEFLDEYKIRHEEIVPVFSQDSSIITEIPLTQLLSHFRKANENEFRREMWLGHGCEIHALYGDDGEMQCNKCLIDFKREPIRSLMKRVKEKP